MPAAVELSDAQPLILQILATRGPLNPNALTALREAQDRGVEPAERAVIEAGLATDLDIASIYAEHLAIPLFAPEREPDVDRSLGRLLPEKLCRDQVIAPVAADGETLDVVFVSPNEMLVVDELQLLTGLSVRPWIAPLSTIETLLEALYPERGGTRFVGDADEFDQAAEIEADLLDDEPEGHFLDLDQPPPPGPNGRIIRMVNQVLEQAIRAGASDIHLEPFEDSAKARIRVDGVLQELPPPSKPNFIRVVSRFKILAKMDIAEKRVPQDGAIAMKTGEKRIDLRVSTVPTVWGEKMVMRLLDKGAIPLHLTGLGLDDRQATDLIESIRMPHGLMLVTGPTGSGKSTTLYSCLNLLNEPKTNICTVEDPVEYKFKGMNQVQVKAQVGLTFASALRAFLRQDPDVIMVGEVRDQETAQICLRAALTGHFVLSTIHTNDALSAVTRLQDMGIEPFMLASTLRVLEAQRLVRRLCQQCKVPYEVGGDVGGQFGLRAGETLYHPRGCDACRGSGYRGRVGIYEVIRMTPVMTKLIQARTSLPELREAARGEGMKFLIDSGIDKARQGLTSLEAVLGVAMAGEE